LRRAEKEEAHKAYRKLMEKFNDPALLPRECPVAVEKKIAAQAAEAARARIYMMDQGDLFDYDDFFYNRIMKKKGDNSYRIFNNINRCAHMHFGTGGILARARGARHVVQCYLSGVQLPLCLRYSSPARLAGSFPQAHGRDPEKILTVWCSNDYLGMSRNPVVLEAMRHALDKYGAGSGGTRNISGNGQYHEMLEAELADLHRKVWHF
jgi:7-keto-8-aminopelargonate synthetase-like enzyme